MAGLPPDVVASIESDAAAFSQELDANTPLPHEPGGSPEPTNTPNAQGGDSEPVSAGAPDPNKVEVTPSGEDTATKVPDSYMGLNLSDIDPDQRAEIIRFVEEQNKFITRLQQNQPTEPAPNEPKVVDDAPPAGDPGEFQMPADAEIIAAMGLSPDDPEFESQVKVALPLAKVMLQQNDTLERLMGTLEADKSQTAWNTTMDGLEKEFGALGIDRGRVRAYAQENGIEDPTAAYWTIAGPVRQQVAAKAQEARNAAMALLRQGAPGRPSGAPSETAATTIPKRDFSKPGTRRQEAKSAFLDALRAAETDTGTNWRDAVAAERDALVNPPATGD